MADRSPNLHDNVTPVAVSASTNAFTTAAKQYAAGIALPPDDRDELLATVRQHAFIQDAEAQQ